MPSLRQSQKRLSPEASVLAEEVRGFLSTRRARLTPAEVGVIAGFGVRRVRGLRRDELATAAGISVDYYSKLEQGRIRNPSILTVITTLKRARPALASGNPIARRRAAGRASGFPLPSGRGACDVCPGFAA